MRKRPIPTPPEKIIIGTRASKLARTQTQTVVKLLQAAHPHLEVEIVTIRTTGDKTQAANVPLSSFGEKGIFAKELEAALLAGEIDLAVHSMKDLAHTLPDGLHIAAVPERAHPGDCLIGSTLDALPQGAVVGTGSVRRRALLLSKRPDLQCREIRGNIDTRLKKMETGDYDAICLAVAGLARLKLTEHIREVLNINWFTPDPGQGALALECRSDDLRVTALAAAVSHLYSFQATALERTFLRALGGGCRTPLGAYAVVRRRDAIMGGMVAAPDGSKVLQLMMGDSINRSHTLPTELAASLRRSGADALLGREPDAPLLRLIGPD